MPELNNPEKMSHKVVSNLLYYQVSHDDDDDDYDDNDDDNDDDGDDYDDDGDDDDDDDDFLFLKHNTLPTSLKRAARTHCRSRHVEATKLPNH